MNLKPCTIFIRSIEMKKIRMLKGTGRSWCRSIPGNEFTKIITDPDYFRKLLDTKHESENLYQSAYNAYLKEDYSGAISLCGQAMEKFSKDELIPKFMLLKSYCIAKTSDERAFKESLKSLIKAYPSSAESTRASEIVAYLNNKIPELKVEEDKQVASEIYIPEMDSPPSFVIIIQNPVFNLNQATFDVISYNIDNYTNKNLRTQGSLVDNKFIMLTSNRIFKNRRCNGLLQGFQMQIK